MKKPIMTRDRVLDLIAAYGAEPGGWPEEDRDPARALLKANPEMFANALAEARALDAVLELERVPEPPQALAAAIIAEAPRPTSAKASGGWLSGFLSGGFRLPAGAALASLGVGLVAGYASAGDAGFDAYLNEDSADTYTLEDSFDDWLETEEDSA